MMSTTRDRLKELLARLNTLPEPQQEAAIEALSEIFHEPYALSDEELSILRPVLAEAIRGENLTDAKSADVLTKPWR